MSLNDFSYDFSEWQFYAMYELCFTKRHQVIDALNMYLMGGEL